MKKQKIQKQSNPISLSAKKSIPKHQQLFTPYKIEWKDQNYPLKNMQNASNTKTFYINMKSELMSIKNDVAKMMRKQCEGSNQNDKTPVKTISIKNKCQMGSKKQRPEDIQKSQYQSVTNNYRSRANSINGIFNQVQYQNSQKQLMNIQAEQIQVNLKDFKLTNPEKTQKKDQNINLKKDINKFVYLQQTTENKDLKANNFKQKVEESCLLEQEASISLKINQSELLKIENQQKYGQLNLIKKKQIFKVENKKAQQNSNNYENQEHAQIKELQTIISNLEKKLFEKEQFFKIRQQKFKDVNQEHSKQLTAVYNLNKQLQEKLKIAQDEVKQQKINLLKLSQQFQSYCKINQNSQEKQFLQKKLQRTVQYIRNIQKDHFRQTNQIQQLKSHLKQQQNQNHLLKQDIRKINTSFQSQLNNLQHQIFEYRKKKQIKDQQLQKNSEVSQKYSQLCQKYTELCQNSKFKDNKIYLYQQQLSNLKQQLKKTKNQILRYNQSPQNQLNQKQQNLDAQNNKLSFQNCKLTNQIQEQKNIIETLKKENLKIKQDNKIKFDQFLCKSTNLELGNQISQKFNEYIDQNYRLKNQISHLKCRLQELDLKNNLLRQQVTLYEQKSNKTDSKRLAIEDWQRKTQQLQAVQLQRDQLLLKNQQLNQFYEIQLMKKQNKIQQLQTKLINLQIKSKDQEQSDFQQQKCTQLFPNITNGTYFLQSYKSLLDEVNSLKQNISQLKQNQKILQFQLKENQNAIKLVKGNYKQTQKDQYILQLRQKLEKKRNYIQNVIMNKINKSANQENMEYFIDQLGYYFSLNQK